MSLNSMVLSQFMRRKKKVVLLLLSMVIAISTLTSVYGLIENMKEDLTRQVGELGPSIIVSPSTKGLTFSYGGVQLPEILYSQEGLSLQDVQIVEEVLGEDARVISPRLVGLLNTAEGTGVEVIGLDWKKEKLMKPWIASKETSEDLLENEVILGAELAVLLQLAIGETVTLNGELFTVKDILLENGSQEDRQVVMNLEKAQLLMEKEGEVSQIDIATFYQEEDDTVVSELSEALPKASVVSMRKEALRVDSMYTRFVRFGSVLTILVVTVSILVIGLTMSLSVKERTREIGILRAIGFRKKQIAKMILLESFIVSTIGGIIGYGIGLVLSRYTGVEGFLLAMIAAIGIGIISSLYPANQATKQDPSIALRYI